ncbi:hypothetical protein [Nocardia gipuzkoensis]
MAFGLESIVCWLLLGQPIEKIDGIAVACDGKLAQSVDVTAFKGELHEFRRLHPDCLRRRVVSP